MNYKQLSQLAYDTVLKTMLEGTKTHPDDDYMHRPFLEDYNHTKEHIRKYSLNVDTVELEHAMTRIVIMLAKLRDENG